MRSEKIRSILDESLSLPGLALWIAVTGLLILCFVTGGWWLLLREVISSSLMSGIMALLITTIALGLARFLGKKRAFAKIGNRANFRWYFGGMTYVFLFILSALGTVNAAFVLWEGPSVVRQDMEEVRSSYKKLQIYAHATLQIAEFDTKKSKVEGLLTALQKEIDNPNGGNLCGVGPYAQNIITDIRAFVPNMPIIRSGGMIRPCDHGRAQEIWSAYRDSAMASLNADPDFLAQDGPGRYTYLENLDKNIGEVESIFDGIASDLVGPTSFAKSSVQGGLETASSRYQSDYIELLRFVREPSEDIPQRVDVSQSQQLGSLAAILQILFLRLGYVSTWSYILIAILLDFALVHFLTTAFARLIPASASTPVDEFRVPGSHPRFLWVNPKNETQVRIRHV